MGSTRHFSKRLGAPLALLLGALVTGPAARAQDASTPDPGPAATASPAEAPASASTAPAAPASAVEPEITHCGDTQVGTGEGMLRPLGQGFYADGRRVRRGCTLLLQRPLKNRPPVPFAPDSFRPIGCGYFRYATSIYWGRPLSDEDPVNEPNGQRADVLTRMDLADAESFEVDADCRPRDARFFYLNHTERPELPAFVAVPRGDGQGYEELGCGFVRYEGRVFFGTRLVEGVHAPSFTPVLGRLPYLECGAGMYGKDRAKVWWQHQLLRGAKAKTFRVPKEENPEFRVACNGKRSFQLASVDKKPNPLCRPKKAVKKRGGR
ncbi:hypothetical protein ATI61_106265 [Archangium gephyra]|uniref:Uncharacterized protein n=1 Tax=Archangium gephyra TaxID=48 RepID=A0ABX9K0A7_9BACT|nr:hypothetical protein [Archangium gephyra]REG30795.1 hypothetical protein ATI61_106265 [Archangium gephyra]